MARDDTVGSVRGGRSVGENKVNTLARNLAQAKTDAQFFASFT